MKLSDLHDDPDKFDRQDLIKANEVDMQEIWEILRKEYPQYTVRTSGREDIYIEEVPPYEVRPREKTLHLKIWETPEPGSEAIGSITFFDRPLPGRYRDIEWIHSTKEVLPKIREQIKLHFTEE